MKHRNGEKSGQILVPINDLISSTLDKIYCYETDQRYKLIDVSTGYEKLDDVILGLKKGQMTLFAGTPGIGKTAVALSVVKHVALKERKGVAFFTQHESADSICNRLLASEAGIEFWRMREAKLTQAGIGRLIDASHHFSNNLFISDRLWLSAENIKAQIRQLENVGLVVIDNIHSLSMSPSSKDSHEDIRIIARKLKGLAQELDIPILVTSVLRVPSEANYTTPRICDLRYPELLNYADVAVFIHRYSYGAFDEPDAAIFDEDGLPVSLFVARNRNGKEVVVPTRFDFKSLEFL